MENSNLNIFGIVALTFGAAYLFFGNSEKGNSSSGNNSGQKLITLPNGSQVPESQMPALGYTLVPTSTGAYWISNLTLQQLYAQNTNNGNSNGGNGFLNWISNNSDFLLGQLGNILDGEFDPLDALGDFTP